MNTVAKIKQLCVERKVPVARLERECGFSNGYIRNLREGKVLSNRLAIIAKYFNVPVEYLLDDNVGDADVWYTDDSTAALAQEMFDDPDMRALFDMKRNMDPRKFKAHMDMMKQLYQLERGTDDTGC